MKERKRFIIVGLIVLALVGGSLYALSTASQTLAVLRSTLQADPLADIPKTTTVTDRNGEILYYLYKDQNRLIAPSSDIASTIKQAVVAAEDERYYYHNGVDLISVVRAAAANLREGNIVSGGSTLTMQLVKNLTGDRRTSWQRKAKEAYLATILEQRYSKDDLLTLYLNIVSLGGNIAGVETASRFYFEKSAKNLTLAEAATLAALITAPEHYSTYPDELRKRRNYVLSRMVATGMITSTQEKEALAQDTPLKSPVIPFKAAHFVMEVVRQLEAQYGEDLYQKGFTVTTTLDIPTQMQAEQAVKDNLGTLARVGAENVGLVAADPKTGHLLAMVGSKDYFAQSFKGQVNLATAPYSYGSSGKPLFYAMLLEKEHWSPGAIMWDVKTQFPGDGRKPYIPRNYEGKYFGPMTLREALGTSRNVTAVKALQMVGLENALNRLQDFGVTALEPDLSKYGPSLAIGGGGIPLVEMVGAYTAFANGGKVNPAQYIQRITDYTGATVKEVGPANRPVLRPEVAYEIADILQDNNARRRVFGSRSLLVIPGETVAAKTGTSEDYRSALTIGFTPEVVVGVIVGNNDYSPLRAGGSGSMAAAPFFNTFMSRYLADKPNTWFARPETITDSQFRTVIGTVRDITAPWQSPTDRFNRWVAEVDDPLWLRAVASSRRKREDKKEEKQVASSSENRGRREDDRSIGGNERE